MFFFYLNLFKLDANWNHRQSKGELRHLFVFNRRTKRADSWQTRHLLKSRLQISKEPLPCVCLCVASRSDLAETFEVLDVSVLQHLFRFGVQRRWNSERSELHQHQLLREILIDLWLLKTSTIHTTLVRRIFPLAQSRFCRKSMEKNHNK